MSESPSEGGCRSDAELPSKEASLASRNKQTVGAIHSLPEIEAESAQQPEAGAERAKAPGLAGKARRRSHGWARITPGMGGPGPQGTPVSSPTAGYGTGAGAPGLHGSPEERTSAGGTRYRVGSDRARNGRSGENGATAPTAPAPLPAQAQVAATSAFPSRDPRNPARRRRSGPGRRFLTP